MFNDMMRAEIWLQETLDSQQSLGSLAARLGYSSSQIRRRFRQCFGTSPSVYREGLRQERAGRLLVHTPLSISEVAERCGYRNHSAFSRAFQRYHHKTPRAYRHSQRVALRRRPREFESPLAMLIRRQSRQAAIVTRRYAPLPTPDPWSAGLNGDDGLPARLNHATAIALLHEAPGSARLPRLDIGVLVDEQEGELMSMPPSLRLVTLPGERCACVSMPTARHLSEVLDRLLGDSLPALGEHYSGEAMRLLPRRPGLELQLPLMAETAPADMPTAP